MGAGPVESFDASSSAHRGWGSESRCAAEAAHAAGRRGPDSGNTSASEACKGPYPEGPPCKDRWKVAVPSWEHPCWPAGS